MYYSNSFFRFIKENKNEDIQKLRLKKWKCNDFDISFAIDQIEIRKKIKSKLPTWADESELIFPGTLSFEQSSSELTARYKQLFVSKEDTVCDLTGGLGIDSYYFALKARYVTYLERNEDYCSIAEYNFKKLSVDNIQVIHSDCRDYLKNTSGQFDVIYIDPARRGKENKRLYALQDCEPDILDMMFLLRTKGKKIVIKASPMVDITQVLRSLNCPVETHVLSVKNECKELIFFINGMNEELSKITCADINGINETVLYNFSPETERRLPTLSYSQKIQAYLYEPNSSIMKAGAYKSISIDYNIEKIHPNSHLYTSNAYVKNFPGRQFEVIETADFTGHVCKYLRHKYPKANISTRNFFLSPDELKKKLNIKDGGDIYIFATTRIDNKKILIICKKAQ